MSERIAPPPLKPYEREIRDLQARIADLEQRERDLVARSNDYFNRIEELEANAVVVPPLPKPTGTRGDAPVWGMPVDLEDVCRQAGNPVLAAYQAGIRRGHAIAENSVRAIPADRVMGEGMVGVERQLLLEVEDALGHAERLGPCGLGLLCQVQDALRANQGGTAT